MIRQPHWYRKKIRYDQLYSSQKDHIENTPKNKIIVHKSEPFSYEGYCEMLRLAALDRNCCRRCKVVSIKVKASQGELSYHLCEKHFNLEFYKKHHIIWGVTS